MSDDLGDRADDYERRLAEAGSTDEIIGGLVRSVAHSQRTVRLLTISLIVDVVLSLAMAGLAVVAWSNASHVEQNTRSLNLVVHDICSASNTAAAGTNSVLQSLINAVSVTESIGPTEKVDRIRKYEAAKVPMLKCSL